MKKLAILIFSVIGFFVFAQKTHTVVAHDNPYNIAKKYGMTQEEFARMNPKVKDGKLAIGDVVNVKKTSTVEKPKTTDKPKSVEKPNQVTPVSNKLGKIILQPKQTIYGITKQYHITETELRTLNPELDSHLKIGDEVTLPAENIKKYADKNAFNKLPSEPVQNAKESISTYVIQPKDTYYGITKKFGITQQQLFDNNPGLEQKGLQPGDVLTISQSKTNSAKDTVVWQEEKPKEKPREVKNEVKTEVPSSVGDDYQTYTVQEGDTVFGIVNKFNINLDQLLTLNPQLNDGLKTGMVLKIKKLESSYVKKSGDALNVVLMLPFGFDDGESKYRNMASDFLSGAKLAIERNAAEGQKLDIKIVDSGSETSFKNSLTQINQNNTDLIIGPFFKSNVLDVLDYVKVQKIPVVAPFANSPELREFNNLVIIQTDEKSYADRMVKEISQVYSDQKIYIVADADRTYASYIKENIEKEYKNAQVILVNSAVDIQLDNNMMTGQKAPVIAVLANDNDAAGETFTKRMLEIAKEVDGVKAFSMYYSSSFEKNTDALSNVNLVYLMDRKINTEGDFEKEILASYKKKYCKTPAKYAIIGFDVVNDMLTRENRKGELFKQMTKTQTQLATKFEFVRAKQNGAFINTGYRVVRLLK